jgi:hypothetical protein
LGAAPALNTAMSKPRPLKTDFRAHDRWLVVALNLGPLAALTNLAVSYALAPETCIRDSKLLLHVSAGVFFVLALAAVFIARRALVAGQRLTVDGNTGAAGPSTANRQPPTEERTRWMANAAISLSIASAVLIVAMEIPNLILRSCD